MAIVSFPIKNGGSFQFANCNKLPGRVDGGCSNAMLDDTGTSSYPMTGPHLQIQMVASKIWKRHLKDKPAICVWD